MTRELMAYTLGTIRRALRAVYAERYKSVDKKISIKYTIALKIHSNGSLSILLYSF